MGTTDHPIGELFEKVNDGKYHVVRFTRSGANSTIQVDGSTMQTKNPKGEIETFSQITRLVCTDGDTFQGRKEWNVLFNDALNTFYLRLYGVRHMVKDHSDSEKETRCRHIGYSLRLTTRVLLYAPAHRQDSTYHSLCYTSHGALAGTRNSTMGSRHEGSIRRPITPWANALTTELRLGDTFEVLFTSPHCTVLLGARCSSMVRAFAHGVMGHRINPSWGGPIELFLVPASAPWLV